MIESKFGIDNRLVFRETFNSEQECLEKHGFPVNTDFVNGEAVLNGTSSYLMYPITLTGEYSVRIRFRGFTSSSYLWDTRAGISGGIGFCLINSAGTVTSSSGTIYVDGVATNVLTSVSKEVVVTGATLESMATMLGGSYLFSAFIASNFELFEIYEGTLAPSDVLNMASGVEYHMPYFNGNEVLTNFNSFKGVMQDYTTATDVEVVKGGSYYTNLFNAATSKVVVSPTDIWGIGDLTILVWFKVKDMVISGRILENEQLRVRLNQTLLYLVVESDGATKAVTPDGSLDIDKYMCAIVTRLANGVTTFYLGDLAAAPVISGSGGQSSGTPAVGSACCIGNRTLSDKAINGDLPIVTVVSGIMDKGERTRWWQNTRKVVG